MEYCAEVQRRFRSTRNHRTRGACRVAAEAEDRSLNLWVRFAMDVQAGVVERVEFEVFGCPHSVAAASWIADWLEGRPLVAADGLSVHEVARILEIPVAKLGKLVRMEDAVASCVEQLRGSSRKGSEDGNFTD